MYSLCDLVHGLWTFAWETVTDLIIKCEDLMTNVDWQIEAINSTSVCMYVYEHQLSLIISILTSPSLKCGDQNVSLLLHLSGMARYDSSLKLAQHLDNFDIEENTLFDLSINSVYIILKYPKYLSFFELTHFEYKAANLQFLGFIF